MGCAPVRSIIPLAKAWGLSLCTDPLTMLYLSLIDQIKSYVGWLVDFGFNGPLRQYFNLYRAVSQREGER